MCKRSAHSLQLLLAVVVLLFAGLGCGDVGEILGELSGEEPDEEDWRYKARRDEFYFFDDLVGEYPHNVVQQNQAGSGECDPGYPMDGNVPVTIDHSVTRLDHVEEYTEWGDPADDTVTITDANGSRTYTRHGSVNPEEVYVYCRTTETDGFKRLECVRFKEHFDGFELLLYGGEIADDDYLCYSATHVFDPSAQPTDHKATRVALVADTVATVTAEAEATLTAEADQKPEDKDPADPVPAFTVDDCTCGGVDAPLVSSRVKKPGTFGSSSGTDFENVEALYCRWIEEYRTRDRVTKKEITKEIWMDLEIYKLNSAQDAQTLFAELRDDRSKRVPDCEEQDDCTVAIADFAPERAFYVENQVFIRGDGSQFPSLHEAYLTRLIATAGGDSFVLHIWVSHPERDPGDSWVVDVSQTLEACAVDVANR